MGDPIIEAAARKGSAELLILSALEDGQLHGYDIAREISRRSGGLLTFHVASLYPLLYKLEDRAWIAGAMGREDRATPAALLPSHCRGRESARETAQPLGSVRRRVDEGRRVETCLSHAAHLNWRGRLRERLAAEGIIPSAHAEAIDEIAEHLNDLHRTAIAEGKSPEQADAVVEAELARMGPLAVAVADRAKRRARSHPQTEDWRTGFAADFRHALRAMRLDRGFSTVVVLTLAIGIGACTAVFSIINALLWGSLPYPNPEQLALVWESDKDNRAQTFIVAHPNYEDWKREAKSFSSMGIWEYRTFNVASDAEPEQVQGIRATASLFTVLGVPPAMGRIFTEAEEAPGHRLVVISDGVWRTHLGGRASAIGSSLRLNGEAYEVIGIMPRGFQFPWRNNGVWVPFALSEQDRQRGSHSFWVAARVKPDVTFESARAEIEQIGRALQQRYEENEDEGATITLMADQGLGTLRTMLTALMGAVSLVFLIACVNVANLQLGRALSRRREFAMRISLGAGLGRLARQLFVESVVLAVAGGIGAVALAWIAARAADLVLTPGFRALPFRGEVPIEIDGRVLLFAAAAALTSAVIVWFRAALEPSPSQPAGPASRRRPRLDLGGQHRAAVARGGGSGARDRRPLRRRPAREEPGRAAPGEPRARSPRSADAAGVAAAGGYLRRAGARVVLRRSLGRRGRAAGDSAHRRDQSSATERRQCRARPDRGGLHAQPGTERLGRVPSDLPRLLLHARHCR